MTRSRSSAKRVVGYGATGSTVEALNSRVAELRGELGRAYERIDILSAALVGLRAECDRYRSELEQLREATS